MERIYRFCWDIGRQGKIESLFIATKQQIEDAIGKDVSFGEILGKHSDIEGELAAEDFVCVTNNKEAVDMFKKYDLFIGYNPLNYISE